MVLRRSSVRSTYVRPPFHVSQREILHLKHSPVSAVNRTASRTCRDKNINFIFRLVDIKIKDFYFVKTFVLFSHLSFDSNHHLSLSRLLCHVKLRDFCLQGLEIIEQRIHKRSNIWRKELVLSRQVFIAMMFRMQAVIDNYSTKIPPGARPMIVCTGRLRPKGLPYSGFSFQVYVKGKHFTSYSTRNCTEICHYSL